MREKYRRMMDIYMECLRRETGRVKIMPPGVWFNQPLHYIIAMETLRMLEVEIHKYVDLLQKIPEEELDELSNVRDEIAQLQKHGIGALGHGPPAAPGTYGAPGAPGGPLGPHGLRNGTNHQPTVNTEEQKVLTEEDIKRQYRESYMKQNGLNDKDWFDHHYGFI